MYYLSKKNSIFLTIVAGVIVIFAGKSEAVVPQSRLFSRIPTTNNVAFITVDNGAYYDPSALAAIKNVKTPLTAFLTENMADNYPAYFQALKNTGYMDIQNHTVSHRSLATLSDSEKTAELCGNQSWIRTTYGTAPVLMRPPNGSYDTKTLQVAKTCGIRTTVLWREYVQGSLVYYSQPCSSVNCPLPYPLSPVIGTVGTVVKGDILLLHWSLNFSSDYRVALNAIYAAGLIPARLVDYV